MNARVLGVVALGSALGALARFALGDFGWVGTLVANGAGSFLIGWVAVHARPGRPLTGRFITDGFCGGFTTFSVFSLEVVQMAEAGARLQASGYVVVTLVVSLAAVAAGWSLKKERQP